MSKSTGFPDSQLLRDAVEQVLSAHQLRGFFPSAVASVFTAERELCRVTIGDARTGTVFDVASLSKLVTTTMILQLIEGGELSLETRALDLLPSLGKHPPLADRLSAVTIQSLLTHTSGLVDWYPLYATGGDFATAFALALSRYGPVSGMVYSDLGFMLLGKCVEAIHGAPLDRVLCGDIARVFGPGRIAYGADDAWDVAPSCYGNPIEEAMCEERGITFDGWRPHKPVRGQANDGNAFYYFGGIAGSAGIFADADAYLALGQHYLRTESPLLRASMREHAHTRGLGWQLGDMYPEGCGHTGFTGTSLYLSLERGFGVVCFTNRLFYPEANPNPTNELRLALHNRVYGLVTALA